MISLPNRHSHLGDASDLRANARRKTYLNGRIVFNLGRSSMSVRVRDLSADGARVCLSIPWPCPPRFTLEVDRAAPERTVTRQCEVVWQYGMILGIRFLDRDKETPGQRVRI
jgi:hypothetical protein